MPFTNYLDSAFMREAFGGVNYSQPATHYVALSTTAPNQVEGSSPTWNFTDPFRNGYTRVAVANNTTTWVESVSPPTDGWAVANGIVITFPTASGSWGTLLYFGVFDDPNAGNCLGFGELTTSETTSTGTVLSFAVQQLQIVNS